MNASLRAQIADQLMVALIGGAGWPNCAGWPGIQTVASADARSPYLSA